MGGFANVCVSCSHSSSRPRLVNILNEFIMNFSTSLSSLLVCQLVGRCQSSLNDSIAASVYVLGCITMSSQANHSKNEQHNHTMNCAISRNAFQL